jgi:hypothetical protein
MNGRLSNRYDIILIQEPHATFFNNIRCPANFRQVAPRNIIQDNSKVRSVIWVNRHLETANWEILEIQDNNDISAIQLSGAYGRITIFNIYNDCEHSENEECLRNYIAANRRREADNNDNHMIWAGDFNRHHPLWDDDADTHLFTRQALRNAEGLITLLAEHDMEMALPKGIPTLQHMRSKNYSRPDNFFCSPTILPYITKCEVVPQIRPPCTDHFPIETHIELPQSRIPADPSYNFRTADWEEFQKTLKEKLSALPRPTSIRNSQQLEQMGNNLTQALQETISTNVNRSKPRPDAKRWWNGDLTKMRKELNRLRSDSYKNRIDTDHASHRELKRKSKEYGQAIISAKRSHWEEYLENMMGTDIWIANKYLKNPVGDGGI